MGDMVTNVYAKSNYNRLRVDKDLGGFKLWLSTTTWRSQENNDCGPLQGSKI